MDRGGRRFRRTVGVKKANKEGANDVIEDVAANCGICGWLTLLDKHVGRKSRLCWHNSPFLKASYRRSARMIALVDVSGEKQNAAHWAFAEKANVRRNRH